MHYSRLFVAIAAMSALALAASASVAQCNPTCQGDFNSDQQVTVDEILVAVNNAMGNCGGSAEQRGCLASGGSVSTTLCCSSAPDFPDMCEIGACGCAPMFSRNVPTCDCGLGRCFSRAQLACVP
ncbi:hypothetical protein L6Q96_14310 [Candidatus Binatia bacterium]|nr:hypothetical protein [Candidatus Binatia bacterium]